MNTEDKFIKKRKRSNNGGKPVISKANSGNKVRLQEYLDSVIELHKLQFVLLNHMNKEIK